MAEKNILKIKSYDFALEIIKVSKDIQKSNEFVLSKQLLRSGTAIGALIREAEYAQSKADFVSKLSIALKEANETRYWIDLIKDSSLHEPQGMVVLREKCEELIRVLTASIKTLKKHN
jgi:four helix bundle protein